MTKKADVYACQVPKGGVRKGCGGGAKVVEIDKLTRRVEALEVVVENGQKGEMRAAVAKAVASGKRAFAADSAVNTKVWDADNRVRRGLSTASLRVVDAMRDAARAADEAAAAHRAAAKYGDKRVTGYNHASIVAAYERMARRNREGAAAWKDTPAAKGRST